MAARDCQATDLAGMTPAQQLKAICRRTQEMTRDQYACLAKLEQGLAMAGIQRFLPAELSDRQVRMVEQVFEKEITSVLAPLAVPTPDKLPSLAEPGAGRRPCDCKTSSGDSVRRHSLWSIRTPLPDALFRRRLCLPVAGGCRLACSSIGCSRTRKCWNACRFGLHVMPMRKFGKTWPATCSVNLPTDCRTALWKQDCVRLEIDQRASDELVAFLQTGVTCIGRVCLSRPGTARPGRLRPTARPARLRETQI